MFYFLAHLIRLLLLTNGIALYCQFSVYFYVCLFVYLYTCVFISLFVRFAPMDSLSFLFSRSADFPQTKWFLVEKEDPDTVFFFSRVGSNPGDLDLDPQPWWYIAEKKIIERDLISNLLKERSAPKFFCLLFYEICLLFSIFPFARGLVPLRTSPPLAFRL